jgi:hypothetical protein
MFIGFILGGIIDHSLICVPLSLQAYIVKDQKKSHFLEKEDYLIFFVSAVSLNLTPKQKEEAK